MYWTRMGLNLIGRPGLMEALDLDVQQALNKMESKRPTHSLSLVRREREVTPSPAAKSYQTFVKYQVCTQLSYMAFLGYVCGLNEHIRRRKYRGNLITFLHNRIAWCCTHGIIKKIGMFNEPRVIIYVKYQVYVTLLYGNEKVFSFPARVKLHFQKLNFLKNHHHMCQICFTQVIL